MLVVDDEFGVAEVLEAMLEDEGYRVLTAINGRQGLKCLADSGATVVMLDYMMPIMNGADMLTAMRNDPAFADIPVVMMSSLDEVTIREACKGYTLFLRKPFRMATVLDAMTRVINLGAES